MLDLLHFTVVRFQKPVAFRVSDPYKADEGVKDEDVCFVNVWFSCSSVACPGKALER